MKKVNLKPFRNSEFSLTVVIDFLVSHHYASWTKSSKTEADDEKCAKCIKGGGSPWIHCDICEIWYHYNCSGLPIARVAMAKLPLFSCNLFF